MEPQTTPRMTGVDPALFAHHNGPRYRTPTDLQVTPDAQKRFLVVGGCLAAPLPEIAARINNSFKGEFVLVNNFDSLPESLSENARQYAFQIVHIPLRTILGNAYFQLPNDVASHEEFLRQTEESLRRYLANAMKLNTERKLLTFVLGFMTPQQNPLGRLQPRYDLRNVMHFIERLNMFLASEVGKHQNAHFVDVDQISSSLGKKHCQDDAVWSFTHGTTLSNGDHDHDLKRIQQPMPMQNYYSAQWVEFFDSLLHEVFAMYRTVQQKDVVKLVVVDLDDTLWRGVAADGSLGVLEGWPMGFMEALLCLKKRGILLAIISRNDEQFIRTNWNSITQGQIGLPDFAALKINFRSKVENLLELLQETNLRPQNVVMVDDNPVERAAIQAGVAGVRVLGRHLYYLKRILLWSSETQQCIITAESSRKTEMVQAQLQRESARKNLSQEEFLASLGVAASISVIDSTSHLNMSRALELFNKTNQFNTNGARYTLEQCHQFFKEGRQLFVIEAEDRFTKYGLVGAAWVARECVNHIVMSCRALGLGIEDAFLAHIATTLSARGFETITAELRTTEANAACRPFYGRNGFAQRENVPGIWSRQWEIPLTAPAHVRLTLTGTVDAAEVAAGWAESQQKDDAKVLVGSADR